MAKLPRCRLLLEPEPNSGAWNMAVDAALLDSAVTHGVATFRWYRWSEPTLSLGYFQQRADVEGDPQWRDMPMVRRLTGGGAILHHHEWTYSVALPAQQTLVQCPAELYDVVHTAIIKTVLREHVAAQLRGESRSLTPEPALCFSRCDAHDVVVAGQKILGSAQRRRKGAILQHGSLLLRRSPLTPQHPGLEDLGFKRPLERETLAAAASLLAEQLEEATLTESERSLATRLCEESVRGPLAPAAGERGRGEEASVSRRAHP